MTTQLTEGTAAVQGPLWDALRARTWPAQPVATGDGLPEPGPPPTPPNHSP